MNCKISKILSVGEHLCKIIKRRRNPAAHQQKSYSIPRRRDFLDCVKSRVGEEKILQAEPASTDERYHSLKTSLKDS